MEQARIDQLKDGTLADYRRVAEAKGRSLEEELRDVIQRNRPVPRKERDYLIALSERLTAASGAAVGSDSTPYIRWMRDTNGGRLPDSPPFDDDDARR